METAFDSNNISFNDPKANKKNKLSKIITLIACILWVGLSIHFLTIVWETYEQISLCVFTLLMLFPVIHILFPKLYQKLFSFLFENLDTMSGRGIYLVLIGMLFIYYDSDKIIYYEADLVHFIISGIIVLGGLVILGYDIHFPSEDIEVTDDESKVDNSVEKKNSLELEGNTEK